MQNTQEKFESSNYFKVVGTLVKADVKTGTMKANGEEYVSVKATVESLINNEKNTYDIDFFSAKLTKADDKGNRAESQLYTSYVNLPTLLNKKVEVTGSISEDRYVNKQNNTLVSTQKLSGRFVRGTADTTADESTFTIGGFILSGLRQSQNKEGEVYRYSIEVGQENYSGKLNKFTLHVNPKDGDIVSGLESLGVGTTFKFVGTLNFITQTQTVEQPAVFGKPIVRTYTNTYRNYYIESGSNEDIIEYPDDVVTKLISDYKANDTELLNNAKTVATPVTAHTAAPAATPAQKPLSTRQRSLLD